MKCSSPNGWFCVSSLALGALLLGVIGCESAPKKTAPRGGIEGDSDRGMVEPVPIKYLDELVAEASQWLAAELPNLPEVAASDTQFVFGVPQTLETSGVQVADGRLRQTLTRLSAELMENRNFTDSFLVISATEAQAKSQISSTAGKDTSGFRDALGRDQDRTKPAVYDPQMVYIMSGKFYQNVDRTLGKRAFHLFIRIEKPQARQRVLERDFVYNLRWNSEKAQWLREP